MRRMNITAAWTALAVCSLLCAHTAEAKKGFYFGLGFGGAVVNGETAIPLQNPTLDPDYGDGLNYSTARVDLNVLVRTEVGSGFAADFRLGYNMVFYQAKQTNRV